MLDVLRLINIPGHFHGKNKFGLIQSCTNTGLGLCSLGLANLVTHMTTVNAKTQRPMRRKLTSK